MATRNRRTANAKPVASKEVVAAVQESEPKLTNENAASYDDALLGVIDKVKTDKDAKPSVEAEIQAVADAAENAAKTETEEKSIPAGTPKAARKRRGADGIVSQPGGSKSKYGIPGGAAWSFPKDGFVLAMAKLMAVNPGMTPAEISCVIHGQDADGNPKRQGTTDVYFTWDLPRKGFGVERKAGGLSVLMPEGRDLLELRKVDSPKLDGLIEARGRADLAALIDEAAEGSDKDGTEEGV